jgi:hypothetical protein
VANLEVRDAIARLERRGGRLRLHGLAPTDDPATTTGISLASYDCVGREDGAAIVSGPAPDGKRWVLRTDVDRTALAEDIRAQIDAVAAVQDDDAQLVVVIRHDDEIQADAGYAQVGCLLGVISTPIGWVIGVATVYLAGGSVSTLLAIAAPIVGLGAVLMSADRVGDVLTSFRPTRDRVVGLMLGLVAVLPGLLTVLLLVVFATWPA